MTTLVTGAGLIGAAFAREAEKRSETVVFVDLEPRADFLRFKLGEGGYEVLRQDIRDLPSLIEVMTAHKIDTVVHTAGLIGARVQQALSLAFDVNLIGSRNVAEATRLTGVRRFVQVSTFGVYDSRLPSAEPIRETFPRGGRRGYGALKSAIEQILDAYAEAYGFELVILRPANVFGLGHFWAGSSAGLKMQLLIEAGLDGRLATLAASEANDTEYVYASDVGRAIDLACLTPMSPDSIFNIGSGRITPYEELLETVREIFPRLQVATQKGVPLKSLAQPLDLTKAREHLGWTPHYSLRDALLDYVNEVRRSRSQVMI